MKFTIILNGCEDNFIYKLEEINGFLHKNIGNNTTGDTIIFYCEDNKKAELIKNCPTTDIKLIKVSRYQPENILSILKQLESNNESELYIFPSDFFGNELSVRFAYKIKGSSLVSVDKIKLYEEKLTCYKKVYSNHMEGEFDLLNKPYCISIAKGCSDKKTISHGKHNIVLDIDMTNIKEDNFVKEYEVKKEEKTSGLENSKFILAVGRGAKNKNQVEKIEFKAHEIGAELGVSRPVAMSGWASMKKLIGVSGIMSKPEVCIAVGVSGAAAFYAGIEKSKYIISINKDDRAPIIKSSDVAIIDNYESILEELLNIIKETREGSSFDG